MIRLTIALILIDVIRKSSTADVKCSSSDECFCGSTLIETEFQCPDEKDPQVIVKIGSFYNLVEVQCQEQVNWTLQKLPSLKAGNVDYFKFKTCPLPGNFTKILEKLGVDHIKQLIIDSLTNLENSTLTADHFSHINIERLIFKHNNMAFIEKDAFKWFTNLIELDLNNNQLYLNSDSFAYLASLHYLDLSGNNLVDLPHKIFQNLKNLRELRLRSNKLIGIGDEFQGLFQMELLDLGVNDLNYLSENSFEDLINLKTVDLSYNKLTSLPEKLFKNMLNLQTAIFTSNKNLHILPDNLLANCLKIKNLQFSNSNLFNLSNNFLSNLGDLQSLSFKQNQLQIIPTLKDQINLKNLDISYNHVKDILNDAFPERNNLQSLDLQNNSIVILRKNAFNNLKQLQTLNLKNNKIIYIAVESFRMLHSITKIVLSHNAFDLPESSFGQKGLFSDNHELRALDLSSNNITEIGDNFMENYNLKQVDLSFNLVKRLSMSELLISETAEINLQNNKITTIDTDGIQFVTIKILLDNNPLHCDCHLYNFVKYLANQTKENQVFQFTDLTCASPSKLGKVSLQKLDPKILTCPLGFKVTDSCSQEVRYWDNALIVNCSRSNLSVVPQLAVPKEFKKVEIDIEENNLTNGPEEGMGYEDVTNLYLSHNWINRLKWLPSNLKVLKLDHNNLTSLNYEILTRLNSSTIENITLGNNPWHCDCAVINFTRFITTNLLTREVDVSSITCRDGRLLVNLKEIELCLNHEVIILSMSIITVIGAVTTAILIALYYRYQQEVKVWLFAHNMFLWFVTAEEIDKDKVYDAFISYSHKDEDFVLATLLPVLENGSKSYKLCLHIRNWVAGEFISKQIVTSVNESRRTIVILSKDFLESEWGKIEFRTAHKQAIYEGRARVILILYGDVNLETDLDEELKAYIRTNTYIKWGDPWFWDKLRYALPHYSTGSTKERTANGARRKKPDDLKLDLIDDFSLAVNSASTPPADHIIRNEI